MWQLDEAIAFTRELQNHVFSVGWSVCLHGGVLYRGSSTKDLDLLFFPLCLPGADVQQLFKALKDFGMTRMLTCEEVHEGWRKLGSIDTKWVEIWRYKRKRIDVFMYGGFQYDPQAD